MPAVRPGVDGGLTPGAAGKVGGGGLGPGALIGENGAVSPVGPAVPLPIGGGGGAWLGGAGTRGVPWPPPCDRRGI